MVEVPTALDLRAAPAGKLPKPIWEAMTRRQKWERFTIEGPATYYFLLALMLVLAGAGWLFTQMKVEVEIPLIKAHEPEYGVLSTHLMPGQDDIYTDISGKYNIGYGVEELEPGRYWTHASRGNASGLWKICSTTTCLSDDTVIREGNTSSEFLDISEDDVMIVADHLDLFRLDE